MKKAIFLVVLFSNIVGCRKYEFDYFEYSAFDNSVEKFAVIDKFERINLTDSYIVRYHLDSSIISSPLIFREIEAKWDNDSIFDSISAFSSSFTCKVIFPANLDSLDFWLALIRSDPPETTRQVGPFWLPKP